MKRIAFTLLLIMVASMVIAQGNDEKTEVVVLMKS